MIDVRTPMCAVGHVAAARRSSGRVDRQRHLTIALDGVRAR